MSLFQNRLKVEAYNLNYFCGYYVLALAYVLRLEIEFRLLKIQ